MKGAPPTRHAQISDMQVIIKCVDQRGREMDERWGIGRLPMLVPIEWAERFHAQHKLFNAAVWEFHLPLVRQHGEAMLRAYDKLDELARGAKGEPLPVDQWEFETPARRKGRFAVDLISDQYGVTKREAETCITKWQQHGYLVTEAGKFHGKASGLRVVKYLEPDR